MGWNDNDAAEKLSHVPYYKNDKWHGGENIITYIYQDAKREPYLLVERNEQKQFRQSHWVTVGLSGRWEIGKPKGPKIPFMLPSIIDAAPEQPIFICEGEKDAETILNFDLEATTNSEGAGKWTPDLNKWFIGKKQVFILEDNDEHGRRHALKVARNLQGIVEEVRIVRFKTLPNGEPMPHKGDVTDWVAAGGTKEKFLELCNAAKIYVGLPPIQVVVGDGARMQDEIEDALIRAEQPVFVRGGILVQPIWSEFPTAKGGKTKLTVLRPIVPSNLDYMLTKHAASFYRFDGRKKANVPADPPEKILRGLLERGHWRFPRVAGVINAPTMRPDGTILDQPGYDAATQLWLSPDANLAVTVSPEPSKADAKAALDRLIQLLEGFPFVSDVDRSVALAAILTAVLRGAFDVAPMFLFLAHTAGTGKSYLVNLISSIVHGRPCPVITATQNSEEMEKRLGSLLLAAAPIISLDNLSTNVEGDLLCQITEQPLVKVRVLGKSETPEIEWRGMINGTGNNVGFAGDMTRRGVTCHLDARIERPETRKFKFDPIDRVLSDRSSFITDALTIARAFFVSKPKVKCKPLGSYGGWSRFVREPLIWLGQPDPVASMDEARANDPKRAAAVSLVEQWKAHLEIGKGYTAKQIIDCASEQREGVTFGAAQDFEFVRPDFNDLLSEQCPLGKGGRIDGKAFGKWLSEIRGQVHLGHRIEIARQSSSHGNRWALVEVEGAIDEG